MVTIDARGCHKEVVEIIRSKSADYILGLENNQGTLLAKVDNFFTQVLSMDRDEWGKVGLHLRSIQEGKKHLCTKTNFDNDRIF